MIPTFLGITFFTFALCQFVPGGPIDQLRLELAGGGQIGGGGAGPRIQLEIPDEQLQQLREFYGFDQPLPVAYANWLYQTVQLNLGQSFRYNEPVIQVIADRFPVSIYYGLVTTIFVFAICIPLGIVKAIRHRTALDTLSSILIFTGYAIPGFALGAVLVNILAVQFQIFPVGGLQSPDAASLPLMSRIWDIVWHSVLPLVAYLLGGFAL